MFFQLCFFVFFRSDWTYFRRALLTMSPSQFACSFFRPGDCPVYVERRRSPLHPTGADY